MVGGSDTLTKKISIQEIEKIGIEKSKRPD